MITGIKIASVEAKRMKDEDMTGLNVNIGIDGVTVAGPIMLTPLIGRPCSVDGVLATWVKGAASPFAKNSIGA